VIVPGRSDKLAAKSIFRDPNPEKQAKHVLLNKWTRRPAEGPQTLDLVVAAKFYETFAEPLSSSKRATMCELFPMIGARKGRELPMSD
jgi:hypothetical protein